MIRLHYANRLENLIAPLADAIAAQQRARPLERVTIVVPSRVIEHFLKHRVSEAIGVAANLDFPFLRRFLARVLEVADPAIRILDVDELELVLFESLRAALRTDSPDFRAPRSYVENGTPTDDEKEVRTYRLARQVARLFRDYSIARRPMLQKWMRHGGEGTALSDAEKWQRQLWISTFDATGVLRAEWKTDASEHTWSMLPDAFEACPTSKLKAALAPTPVLHLFGIAYVGPAYLRILAQIANLTEVHLYSLNPCLEFWEDVEPLSRIDRETWTRRHSKIGSALEDSIDPFNLEAAGDTPALRLWSRPGREYFRMLNELTECDFDAHFTHESTASLLGALREDILNRAPERTPDAANLLDNDGSIRFLACPGVAREAEIVANEVWAMLEDDARGRDPLRFHQVGVIVPDAMYEDYLPHLESAFSRLHQLPMNIVNRGSGSRSPVREAIAMLLRLPLGRFSRDEMLHLLNHPAIRGDDAEVEADQAGRWCEDLGIFFGADAHDLANTYIPPDNYHWDQGIRRLALGVFMTPDADQEPRFYSTGESVEYLPYETSQDEIPAVAAFVRNARTLLTDATAIRSRRLTLAQWSQRLSDLILEHIHVDDPADERVRERCIEAIESMASPDLTAAPVSYQIAHEIASARTAEMESQHAQFTESGIAIGPLSALRAIPFRAIFMLGLNETQFPERDRRDPMDLRLARRKAGDVTPTERDRYLFLETLLAARERICLSYLARDAKTGDRLDPSSVVRELQFILRDYVKPPTLDGLTIEHPLSRYDRRYFPEIRPPDSGRLTSYDSEARRGAAMAAMRSDLARHCEGLPLPGRDEPIYQRLTAAREAMRPALRMLEIPPSSGGSVRDPGEISLPISALRKFLECPLQGAAQHALGIYEDDGDGLEEWLDEPIAQSILARTTLLREVFWKARGAEDLLTSEYATASRISRLAGEAPAGPFALAAERIDRANIEQWIEQARNARCGSLDRWHEIRMGRGDESAKADRVLPELAISLRAKVGDGDQQIRLAKIRGSLGFTSPSGDASIRLVLRDKAKPKDFLGGFLAAIVLAAAGELAVGQFHAIVLGAGKSKAGNHIRSLRLPTRDEAHDYLSDLISDLLFDKNHYFLPIEAVEEVEKEKARDGGGNLLDVIYDARDNEFGRCASDYGPIRNARRFDPPTLEQLKRILDRRFRLIRAIFQREQH